MSKSWIPTWIVLDFYRSKREPWEEPDRLALLQFGQQWWSNVIVLEEWKKHRLSSLIREGQFEKFTDLFKTYPGSTHQYLEIEEALFDFAGNIESLLAAENYWKLHSFLWVLICFDDERSTREKVYGMLEAYSQNIFFTIKPKAFVGYYKFLKNIPEGIISAIQKKHLLHLLEKTLIQNIKTSLESEKNHPFEMQMVYEGFFYFMEWIEDLSPTSSLRICLSYAFEQNFPRDIKTLLEFGIQTWDFLFLWLFFDGVYKNFGEQKISQYFFCILRIASSRGFAKNKYLQKAIADILKRYSFPREKVLWLLRHSHHQEKDLEDAERLFNVENWSH